MECRWPHRARTPAMAACASADSSHGNSLGDTAQLRCRGFPPGPTSSGRREAAPASSASTGLTTSGISAARSFSCARTAPARQHGEHVLPARSAHAPTQH